MNVNVLSGYILVKPYSVEENVTPSGIILPKTRREDVLRGTVFVTGESLPNEPMEVSEGDIVGFGKNAGREIEIDDVEYRLMQQREIHYFIPVQAEK